MNPLASSSLASSATISKSQVGRFGLDRILADLKAEDWLSPESVADHSIRLFIDKRQRPTSARLYARYVKAVENVSKLFTSSTLFRNFSRKVVPIITQNDFKERFLTRCNALTTGSSKRSASVMLEEEEVEEQVEEQEIAPGEASAQLLGSQMSVDEAIAATASQANPTALTYSQVKILMFERAQNYFTVYQVSKDALKSQQRKLMSCGASLILDLVDMTDGNECKDLFSADQWKILNTKFTNEFKIQDDITWPETLQAHWKAAISKVSHVEMFAASKRYINNLLKDPLPMPTTDAFELMLTVFNTSQYAQSSRIMENASEYDILYQLWLPVLMKLFPGPLIKVKIGETVNSVTTEHKMLLYPDELNIVGFKTDVRFIAQVGASFDLASGEACLIQPGESKVIDDHAKLMREGKCNAMALYEVTSTKITHAWMVQFIGLQAVFSTVTYSDYDLHVATLQEKILFPDSVTSFTNTRNTTKFIDTLLKFQFDLNRTARLIQDTIDQADRSLLFRENIFEPMEFEAPSTQAPPSALSFHISPKKDLTRAKYPQANQEALLSGAEALIQVAQEATATRD